MYGVGGMLNVWYRPPMPYPAVMSTRHLHINYSCGHCVCWAHPGSSVLVGGVGGGAHCRGDHCCGGLFLSCGMGCERDLHFPVDLSSDMLSDKWHNRQCVWVSSLLPFDVNPPLTALKPGHSLISDKVLAHTVHCQVENVLYWKVTKQFIFSICSHALILRHSLPRYCGLQWKSITFFIFSYNDERRMFYWC